jgi:hypothetical protein
MVPALITGIRGTAGYPVMLSDSPAFVAVNAIGVQKLPQPLQAGSIVGKLSLKITDGVLNWFSFYVVPELLVCHDFMVSGQVPTVKG